ncbi:MAG: hypothetical protein COB59_07725 [Rhodospirillaceae bacterium]|nr:MAG: hypothetical protein COB59_07725 [Rhodospirillaceae bacterium]
MYVNWLIDRKNTISKQTWKFYKAASVFTLSTQFQDLGIQAADRLRLETQSGALKYGTGTSAHKYKCVPPKALKELLVWTGGQRSKYGKPLVH